MVDPFAGTWQGMRNYQNAMMLRNQAQQQQFQNQLATQGMDLRRQQMLAEKQREERILSMQKLQTLGKLVHGLDPNDEAGYNKMLGTMNKLYGEDEQAPPWSPDVVVGLQQLTAPVQQDPQKRYKSEDDLRKELNRYSGKFINVRDNYATIMSLKDGGPSADIGLIFAIMKMFDPDSVVRESEFGVAASAGSVFEQAKAFAKRMKSGERLSRKVRDDFVDTALRVYGQWEKNAQKWFSQYENIAKKRKLDWGSIYIDPFMEYEGTPKKKSKGKKLTANERAAQIMKERPNATAKEIAQQLVDEGY